VTSIPVLPTPPCRSRRVPAGRPRVLAPEAAPSPFPFRAPCPIRAPRPTSRTARGRRLAGRSPSQPQDLGSGAKHLQPARPAQLPCRRASQSSASRLPPSVAPPPDSATPRSSVGLWRPSVMEIQDQQPNALATPRRGVGIVIAPLEVDQAMAPARYSRTPAAQQAASVWIIPTLKWKIATAAATESASAHASTLATFGASNASGKART
jgi:hypothetical protein